MVDVINIPSQKILKMAKVCPIAWRGLKRKAFRVVVVTQLVEQLLLKPEVHGSYPVIEE